MPKKESSNHVNDLLLELLALELQMLNRLEEQLVAIPLSCALYREDKVIRSATKLDLAVEFRMAQAFPANGILHGVHDNSLELASMALVAATCFGSLLLGDLLQADDALREALGKLFSISAQNRLENIDGR